MKLSERGERGELALRVRRRLREKRTTLKGRGKSRVVVRGGEGTRGGPRLGSKKKFADRVQKGEEKGGRAPSNAKKKRTPEILTSKVQGDRQKTAKGRKKEDTRAASRHTPSRALGFHMGKEERGREALGRKGEEKKKSKNRSPPLEISPADGGESSKKEAVDYDYQCRGEKALSGQRRPRLPFGAGKLGEGKKGKREGIGPGEKGPIPS